MTSTPPTTPAQAAPRTRGLSRRSALASGGVAAAGVALAPTVGAAAAVGYAPGRYPRTPVLPAASAHLVRRFSYGLTPALTAEVTAAGGGLAWFEKQLATAYDGGETIADWWPDLHLDPQAIWARHADGTRAGYRVSWDYTKQLMVRRITSPRQVLEVMQEFWENHLHVPVDAGFQFTWRKDYGDTIRAHALGRFDEMLEAAITHPAMLIYLNAASSTLRQPNENLGRELLELHTVGWGAFDENDVKSSAHILTGWRVETGGAWLPRYVPLDHWLGKVTVKDFTDLNLLPDGRDLTRRYLRYLAHHPQTAARIARRLATKFVSDRPSSGLVDRLAAVYLANDTAIAPVLRALVRDPEFLTSVDSKLRDPGEDVVATHRALGTTLLRPAAVDDFSAANTTIGVAQNLGLAPLTWPRPDGTPLTNDAWSSPARAMASFEAHWQLAGGRWPTSGITYRRPRSWVPVTPIRFRDLVDHLSRALLGRVSDAALLEGCCVATGIKPGASITAKHPLLSNLPVLLTAVLDSPGHYYR